MSRRFTKAFLLIAIAQVILSGCAFQNLGTFEESDSSSEIRETDSVAGIGEKITGDGFSITLHSARYSTSDSLGVAPENGQYLILDVAIENSSSEENSISSLMSFNLRGPDGFEYSQSLTAKKKGSLDGSIRIGGKLRGEIAYDVPALESFEFSFKNTIFADSVMFQIKSDQIK